MPKVNVFISYSHQDRDYLDKLKIFLHEKTCPLLNVWDDGEIPLGGEWNEVIKTHLNEARIVLLLISQNFLISDYIEKVELKTALERDKRKECSVIPIFTRHCNLDNYSWMQLQGLPKEMRFLSDAGADIDNQLSLIQKDINDLAALMLTNENISTSLANNDEKSANAKVIQELTSKRKIFLSVRDEPEARKKRQELIIQADAKVKYDDWPYEIIPGIKDVQEMDKMSAEERTERLALQLSDSLYSVHIVASENDLKEGTNKIQYDMAKGLHPAATNSVFRTVIWLLSADLLSKVDKDICQNPLFTGNDYGAFFDKIASLDVDKEKEIAERKKEFFPNKRVYMYYDFTADHDNELRIDLKTKMEEKNYCVRWNTFDEDCQKEIEDLEACDGAVVFYGAAQPKWFMVKQAKLLDMKNLRSRAICLDEPEIQKKFNRDVSKNEFVTIQGKANLDAGLSTFLERLQP